MSGFKFATLDKIQPQSEVNGMSLPLPLPPGFVDDLVKANAIHNHSLGEPYPSVVMKPPGPATTHGVTPSVAVAVAGMQKMFDMGTISQSTIAQFAQQMGVPLLEDEVVVSASLMESIARQVEQQAKQPKPTESSKPKKKGKRTDEELTQIKMQLSALNRQMNTLLERQHDVLLRLGWMTQSLHMVTKQQEFLAKQQVAFAEAIEATNRHNEQTFQQMMTLLDRLDADRQERAKRSPVDGFQARLSRRKIRKRMQEQAEAGKGAQDE